MLCKRANRAVPSALHPPSALHLHVCQDLEWIKASRSQPVGYTGRSQTSATSTYFPAGRQGHCSSLGNHNAKAAPCVTHPAQQGAWLGKKSRQLTLLQLRLIQQHQHHNHLGNSTSSQSGHAPHHGCCHMAVPPCSVSDTRYVTMP